MDLFAPVPVIDAYLEDFMRTTDMPANLRDAVLYAVVGGGKRLRPILAWHSCLAAGGNGEDSLPAGAAVELIHAFSLVHDDLPALDNDDLRRGKPTLHKHAGEAMALLAGDMALTLAFRILAERAAPSRIADLTRTLATGTSRMINGQILDTLGGFDPTHTPAERVNAVHTNKTGALIRAACLMGAFSTSAADSSFAAIDAYADRIGLIFQIVDDLIDVEQSAEHTGKRTGKDQNAGKLTYPAVFGINDSRRIAAKLLDEALVAIAPLGPKAQPLADLAKLMATRTK